MHSLILWIVFNIPKSKISNIIYMLTKSIANTTNISNSILEIKYFKKLIIY